MENQRLHGGRVAQRHLFYLGKINSSQAAVWRKAIEVLDEDAGRPRTLALFPEDHCTAVAADASMVCELARNNDPLRGVFRVQSRPL